MKVTNFMTRKWIKATFEIVAAIILMIFGTRALRYLPPQAQGYDIFWFMHILIWFLIITCLVFAYVNIAQSLIGKAAKNRIEDLSEKLETIETKLSENFVLSAAPTDATPPPPEDLGRPSKRTVIVVLVVTAALLISVGAIGYFVFGFKQMQAGGQTPLDAFNQLIDAMNDKNAMGVIDQTIFKFFDDNNRTQAIDGISSMLSMSSQFHVTVNHREVIQKDALAQTDKDNITTMISEIEEMLGIDVSDYCAIDFNVTVSMDQGTMYQGGLMPALLIGGSWYLIFEFGDQDGYQDQSSPEKVFNTFIDAMNDNMADDAVDLTVWKFDQNRSQYVTEISNMISGSFHMNINSHFIKNQSQFNQSENDLMNDVKDNISQKYGRMVSEFVLIYYQGTMTTNTSINQPVNDRMPCVKIDNEWMLVLPDQPGQQQITISMNVNYQSSTANLTVTGIIGGPAPSLSSVFLTVILANSTTSISMQRLDMMMTGSWMLGVMFNDTNDPANLNVNDYFLLDNSIYTTGSVLKLTDSSGMKMYCEITLT